MPEKSRPNKAWAVVLRVSWLVLVAATIVLLIAALPGYTRGIGIAENVSAIPQDLRIFGLVNSLLSIFCFSLSLVLAGLIFWRNPSDAMSVYVSFYLIGYAALMSGPLEIFMELATGSPQFAFQVQSALFTTPTLILLYAFPNGRLVPPWTRWLILLSILGLPAAFMSDLMQVTSINTPYTMAFTMGMVVSLLVGVIAQIYRYRRISTPIERQQTKWVIYGLLIWFGLLIIQTVPFYYLQNLPDNATQLALELPLSMFWWFSLMTLPLSIGLAILRYRLFDIDVIIRRTLVYAALTVTLAAVFIVSVALLQAVFSAVSGQRSAVATVISTLLIAALFAPLRRRIQTDIDRRFYRQKYDAEKTLERFAATLREEVELEALSSNLLEVVSETMQPTAVNLWLLPVVSSTREEIPGLPSTRKEHRDLRDDTASA